MGVSATQMERKGIETDRGNINREVRKLNREIAKLNSESRQVQNEISCIRDDMRWTELHETISDRYNLLSKLEIIIDKAALLKIQESILRLQESAKNSVPIEASEGRTVNYNSTEVPYFEYHKNKAINDCAFIKDKINRSLSEIDQRQEAQTKSDVKVVIRENAERLKAFENVGYDVQKMKETLDGLQRENKIPVLYMKDGHPQATYFTTPSKAINLMEQTKNTIPQPPVRTETTPKPAEPTRPQPQETPKSTEQPKPQEQGGFAARREALKPKEVPQEKPKIDIAYADRMAKQLAKLRNEFIRETARSQERTSYQPNPIYNQQAGQIEDYAKYVKEHSETINQLKAKRDGLGMFKGKEKKDLQGKIDNFERLRRDNADKLKALGVSDPSRADETVKEKRQLAAQEQNKAQAVKLNEGAGSRAAEAKAALFELAKTVPADQQQAVRSQMEQYADHSQDGMTRIKADIEIQKLLDEAFKDRTESKEHEKVPTIGHDRD